MCLCAVLGRAQFLDISQTMMKQIAALEAYTVTLEKGYKIASEGLRAIGDIKTGEFKLHQAYFSSLSVVSPGVKNSAKTIEIIEIESSISKNLLTSLARYRSSGVFSQVEISYMQSVSSQIVVVLENNLAALADILTDGKLAMDDGERIARIDRVYESMVETDGVSQRLTDGGDVLASERLEERGDYLKLEKLYGLK